MPYVQSIPNEQRAVQYLTSQLAKLHRWIRLPISYETPDAAPLFVVPRGHWLIVHRVVWEISEPFAGGKDSAIGISSDAPGYDAKGSLLGGRKGDRAATLIPRSTGEPGTCFAADTDVVLPEGSAIRFDRIASAFTSGTGHVLACVYAVPHYVAEDSR